MLNRTEILWYVKEVKLGRAFTQEESSLITQSYSTRAQVQDVPVMTPPSFTHGRSLDIPLVRL